MPDPNPPLVSGRPQLMVPVRSRSVVTAAETETDTHWKALPGGMGNDSFRRCPGAAEVARQAQKFPMAEGEDLVPVGSSRRLTEVETRTRTHWAPANANTSLDDLADSGFRPIGTVVRMPGRLDLSDADLAAERTAVTGADTQTNTKWKVHGRGADKLGQVVDQSTVLTDLDTRTRQRWTWPGAR